MTKKEITSLAETIAEIVTVKVINKLQDTQLLCDPTEYVDSEEAARILGLSRAYLMQVKDRYPHIKLGANQQSQIRFRKADLLKEFNKYVK